MTETMPHNNAVENSLIASMIVYPETISSVDLKPFNLYHTRNQIIFTAIQEMHSQGIIVDVVTLSQFLIEAGKIDDIGGEYHLSELLESSTSKNLSDYARIIKEYAIRRELIQKTSLISRQAQSENIPVHDIL